VVLIRITEVVAVFKKAVQWVTGDHSQCIGVPTYWGLTDGSTCQSIVKVQDPAQTGRGKTSASDRVVYLGAVNCGVA